MAVEIVDNVAKALDRVLDQFRDKPRFDALLRAYLAPFQELEEILQDLYVARTLTEAEEGSDSLRIFARIVGASSLRKVRVYTQIRANRSSGRVKDFGDVLTLLGLTSAQWHYSTGTKWIDLSVYVDETVGISDILSADGFYLGKLLQSMRAAGEWLRFTYSDDDFFGYDGNPNSEGWGSVTDSGPGGPWAGQIQ